MIGLAVIFVLFGLGTLAVSFLIAGKSSSLDSGEISTYIVFVSWGSLLLGLCLSKFAF